MNTVTGFIKKEFAQALRDRKSRLLIFAVPVIQLVVLGFALSSEVKNVRLAVFARPGDSAVWQLARRCYSSGWFVAAETKGVDPTLWLQSGRADAVLVAPQHGLGNGLAKGDARLQLLIDASNAVKARQIENYVRRIAAAALPGPVPGPVRAGFDFDMRVLYNPAMESAVFLVPGVMVIVMCVVSIMLTAMALAREKETGTFETLISAPVSTAEIMLGKSIPYFLLTLVNVPLVLLAAVFVFGVPMRGPVWLLAVSAMVFVFATVSVGVFISTAAANQQQAMMGGFLFLFPGILLSGVMFPVENIPAAFKWLCYVDPMNYFMSIVRNIMLKGGGLESVARSLAGLGALAVAAMSLAALRFRQQL
ncbi:MAG: ABC transporter permease [Elusimicrobiaceae bacterium]|nr:ABC transporter permease [Elusimicrobiaceae bacterium]